MNNVEKKEMKMSRIITILICVALIGCILPIDSVSGQSIDKKLTLGYVAGVQDPFMVLIEKGAEDKAKELGNAEVISQIPGVWSVDVQSPIWKAMAARGVDLVFGCPVDKEALIPVLRDVYQRGVPVITTDTYIGDGDYTSGSDSFVLSAIHTDNIAAGEKAGNALAELLGGKGKVYLQEFHVGVSTSDERSLGFVKAIEQYPDIELVGQNSCDDDQDLAQTQTAAMLKAHPDINGVFGNNLFACLGAAMGVYNAGLSGAVIVVGFDAAPSSVEMLRKGWMDAIVSQQPYKIGQEVAIWAVRYLREGVLPPRKINIGSVLFTKENVNDPEMDKYIYK